MGWTYNESYILIFNLFAQFDHAGFATAAMSVATI